MILALLFINHFVACAWYSLTLVGAGENWATYHHFDDAEWSYQYLTSFHWSITQFTPSSMHVQPQNMSERCFAIGVVIFALLGFSWIVGSITGSLSQLRGMQEETSK